MESGASSTTVVEPLLGTRAELSTTPTMDSRLGSASCADAEHTMISEVKRLEKIFTTFDAGSDLRRYGHTGKTRVPELLEVIALATSWAEQTEGLFHPGMQALMELWDKAEQLDRQPGSRQLRSLLSPSVDKAPIDNLNAIAKGWIADRGVSAALACRDVDAVWLNLGGDVVHRGSGSVVVGVEDPLRAYDNAKPLATVVLSNEAVATSGGTRRWWTIDGRRYPKVLDPRTGRPVDRLVSVSVVATEAATADVLATIGLIADPEVTLRLVRQHAADCLLVFPDGQVLTSGGRFSLKPSSTR